MSDLLVDAEADAARDQAKAANDAATGGMSTQPAVETTISLGFKGWVRFIWRQLTSMRTALLLLFLLALASIPGSLLPQRGVDPTKVAEYLTAHPGLGSFFDTIGLFTVFSAPWYAAIYLLLCISLAGCVIPRTRVHWRAMRSTPPAAPSRLSRMPEARTWQTSNESAPAAILAASATVLRARRWRVSESEFDGTTGWVAAEKGYLRETGNLIFHTALLVLLVAFGAGALLGWRGQVLLVEGKGFSNTVSQYDTFKPGRLVDREKLPPFSFTLDSFSASYQPDGEQKGTPRSFEATVTLRSEPSAAPEQQQIGVNSPLRLDGGTTYLIGHGYAPEVEVRDKAGVLIYSGPTVFLPTDANFTSRGVIKMPDVDPQLGIEAIFLPTAFVDPEKGPISVFPAADDPALFMSAWQGNLGLDDGVPQSVYKLDFTQLKRTGIKALRLGESWALPEGAGTIKLTGVAEFATFDVVHDPAKVPALIACVLAILGLMLSLFVPRRRVWVRVTANGAASRVEVAGLSRTDEAGLRPTVDDVAERVAAIAAPIEATSSMAAQQDQPVEGTLGPDAR